MSLYETIREATVNAAAISVHAKLSAAHGGPRVLPPTYPGDGQKAKHNATPPDERGVSAWVSIDSPASFANRVEDQLVRSRLGFAPLRVQLPTGRTLSTLELPHRSFDAILRDSTLDGVSFRNTEIGQAIISATPQDARALLCYDPGVLLFGGWDSTALGPGGGKGAKWPAALSGEIYGLNARQLQRAGNRIDPLGLEGTEPEFVEEEDGSWRLAEERDKDLPVKTDKGETYPRRVKLSRLNHGNALSLDPKGALVDEIHLRAALSLSRLRRYRFGESEEEAIKARTALVAAGVFGLASVLLDGLDLRRDCELVADEAVWTVRGPQGATTIAVDRGEAEEAARTALAAVDVSVPVNFTPGKSLQALLDRGR